MWFSIFLIVLLLLASAFCSGSETALFSLRSPQLERLRAGSGGQRRVASLVDRPNRTLATLLLSNMVINVGLSVLISSIALDLYGQIGLGIAIPVATVLLVLFGEILPKTLGLRQSLLLATWTAPAVELLARLLAPLRIVLTWMADRATPRGRAEELSREELGTLLAMAREEGRLSSFESAVLRRLLNFRDLSVERFLTPRVDVVALDRNASSAEAARLFRENGVNRLPVVDGSLDHVLGVLLLKDFLTSPRERSVTELMREAIFVPASLPAPALFARFSSSRLHMAIVLDEHGGTEGIVTLEDLLEALAGDIRDESDLEDYELEELDENEWRCDARIEIEELIEQIDWPQDPEADEVTLSGILERELGRVPRAGDEIRRGPFVVRVLTAHPSRALRLGIRRETDETWND